MTVLTVWNFADPDSAREAETELGSLVAAGAVVLLDGAVVSWAANRTTPRSREVQNMPLVGALGSGFWGLLFGATFFVPLLESLRHDGDDGADVGTSALTGVGIGDAAIRTLRASIGPGKSALFAVLPDQLGVAVVDDALSARIEDRVSFTLTAEQENNLREIFGVGRRRVDRAPVRRA